MSTHEVQVMLVQPRWMATVPTWTSPDNLVKAAMGSSDQVWAFLGEHPEISHPGTNIWLYRSPGSDEPNSGKGLHMEAGAEVHSEFKSDGPVVCRQTPGGQVATVKHIGPYSGMGESHTAIRDWCQANHKTLSGTSWEVYGHWNEDESKLETEIFYLLA